MKPGAGVRARAALAVAIAGLLVSTSMALLTFHLTRSYLTAQRDRLANRQAYLNARLLQDVLPGVDDNGFPDALSTLTREGDSQVILWVEGRWFGSSVGLDQDDVPVEIRRATEAGDSARQRVLIDGVPYAAVGVPLLGGTAAYYELFPLTELERTLHTMALVLSASAVATTVVGAAFGASFSRRVLRPLLMAAQVARRIAAGETHLRLPPSTDREMAPIYESFNDMVDALADRIEHERRFAADVSHELRTPVTALVSSVAVLDGERRHLPERARLAVDILDGQVDHLRGLVLDLLDMARMESGMDQAQLEPVDLRSLLERLLTARDRPAPDLRIEGLEAPVLLDGRRVERVVSNLLDNADAYGGGAVAVAVEARSSRLQLTVDDAGPGVDPAESSAIFERLHRGEAARRSGHRGSGLGLALAAEHLRLQGGSIHVTRSDAGGARFVVDLPLVRA